MQDQRFLGHILNYDPVTNIVTLKADFLDPEKQEIIEQLCQSKDEFAFSFKKPFKKSKMYWQLKKYFLMIKHILIGFKVTPNSEVVKALDMEHKKRCFPVQMMDVGGQVIPIVKSKADMSFDEMQYLTDELIETYREILIKEGVDL